MSTNFGRDISCMSSLRTGRFASGPRLVGESLYRRLTTSRGTVYGGEDEANFGDDLTEMIGSTTTSAETAALADRIKAAAKRDERISAVDVFIDATTTTGGATEYAITIDADTDAGPFTLQLAASAVSVDLIGIEVSS